jgi:hypothetical protein
MVVLLDKLNFYKNVFLGSLLNSNLEVLGTAGGLIVWYFYKFKYVVDNFCNVVSKNYMSILIVSCVYNILLIVISVGSLYLDVEADSELFVFGVNFVLQFGELFFRFM